MDFNSLKQRHYFDNRPSRGYVSLFTAKTITLIATGLLGIFLPIFLYNLFGKKFHYLALFYALGYFFYTLTLIFFVKFLNKFGFRRALRLSVLFGAAYYAVFYFMNQNNWHLLIPLAILIVTLYRFFYWIPYRVDFAKFTDPKNRARQFSAIKSTGQILGIFIPLVAGFIISHYSYDVLFIMAIIIYLISGISLLHIPRTREKYRWGYKRTLNNLFDKENRKEGIAFAADGAETTIINLVWPVFIYEILNGNYLEVGIVSTMVIGASATIQLILGKKLDTTLPKHKVLKTGSALSAITWVVKIFIQTSTQIFLIGAFHNLVRIFTRIPFSTLTYEIMADEGHYVDEFTVFRELWINGSRVIILFAAAAMSLYFPISYLFILAAIAAIGLNLLRPRVKMVGRIGF